MATLDRLIYRHAAAEGRFAALARDPSAPRWRAWALLGEGLTRVQRWDAGGVGVLERAAAAADSLGDARAAAQALLGILRVASRTVGADSVVRLVSRARSLAPPADSSLTALLLCAEAGVARPRGMPTVDSLLKDGIAQARSANDHRAVGRCLLTLAQARQYAGRQGEALLAFHEAWDAARKTSDADLMATVSQQLAFQALQFSYSMGDGRAYAQRAIEAGSRSGNQVVVAYARLNLAQLAVRVGDVRDASRQLDSAKLILSALRDRPGLAARDFVAGDAAFAAGRLAEAQAAYHNSLEGYRTLGSPVTQITLRLALLAVERGAFASAAALFDSVAADAERWKLAGVESDLVYYRGLLALRTGQPEAAAALFRRFRLALPVGAALYQLDAGLREAEALAYLGRLSQAEARLDSAFARVEHMRRHLSDSDSTKRNPDLVKAMAVSRRFEFDPDLGLATTINRLAMGGRIEAAFRFAEAERGRILWVHLTRRGLLGQDSVAKESRGEISFPAELRLEEMRRLLGPETALLEYTTGVGGEPTTLFVLDHAGLRAFTLPAADSLAGPIERFAGVIEGGGYPRALARALGVALLDSAVASLPATVTRLIVMPGGPIHRLPLDALVLPTGRPLLERFAISTAPSARLAVEWLARTRTGGPGTVLAFGDANFSGGLARLPGSAREAAIAAGPGGTVLLDRRASEAALKRQDWNGIGVLHLATHASTEEWGILSGAVHLSPGEGDDGHLGPEEITFLSVPVDLVVLSGCRTAGGVVVFGEGIQGLVTPFLEAGAKSVVASYWEVGDQRVIPLMERLYAGLRRGQTAGAALHSAKLASLRAGNAPVIWAAFGLTGDPGVRPLRPATAR